MNELRLNLDQATQGYKPGETLSGDAEWYLDEEPKSLDIRLFWFTKGKGTVDVEILETIGVESAGRQGRQRFTFKLPETPYSFSGSLISLIWSVEVVVDSGKQVERQDFVMAPGGKQIVLKQS